MTEQNTEPTTKTDIILTEVVDRLENCEGYYDDIQKLLTNHMHDYAEKQTMLVKDFETIKTGTLEKFNNLEKTVTQKINDLRTFMTWGFGIFFSLLILVLGGLVSFAFVLFQKVISGG